MDQGIVTEGPVSSHHLSSWQCVPRLCVSKWQSSAGFLMVGLLGMWAGCPSSFSAVGQQGSVSWVPREKERDLLLVLEGMGAHVGACWPEPLALQTKSQ